MIKSSGIIINIKIQRTIKDFTGINFTVRNFTYLNFQVKGGTESREKHQSIWLTLLCLVSIKRSYILKEMSRCKISNEKLLFASKLLNSLGDAYSD